VLVCAFYVFLWFCMFALLNLLLLTYWSFCVRMVCRIFSSLKIIIFLKSCQFETRMITYKFSLLDRAERILFCIKSASVLWNEYPVDESLSLKLLLVVNLHVFLAGHSNHIRHYVFLQSCTHFFFFIIKYLLGCFSQGISRMFSNGFYFSKT